MSEFKLCKRNVCNDDKKTLDLCFFILYKSERFDRGIVQLVEHRSPKPSVVGSNPAAPANLPNNFLKRFKDGSKVKVSPVQFFRQVKQEVKKVTWPTKKEVSQVSMMIIVIVAIASVFFFCVDLILGWGVKLILGLGA